MVLDKAIEVFGCSMINDCMSALFGSCIIFGW